jgi:hypothetical protein
MTPREYFAWQEAVVGRTDISPKFKIVAWALALFRNAKNGCCNPSYLGLAKRAGVSERTAKRAIALFEKLGFLAVTHSHGGRKSNRNEYTLILPQGVSAQTPQGVSGKTRRGVSEQAREGCQSFGTQTSKENIESLGDSFGVPPGTGRETPHVRLALALSARWHPSILPMPVVAHR